MSKTKDLKENVTRLREKYEEAEVEYTGLLAAANAANASVRRMYRDLTRAQILLELSQGVKSDG